MKRACFWRFFQNNCVQMPANKKSAFIELTSFKSFDSEVPSFYFGSMPPFAHKRCYGKNAHKLAARIGAEKWPERWSNDYSFVLEATEFALISFFLVQAAETERTVAF